MTALFSVEPTIVWRLQLLGDVQGFGVRPTVARAAGRHGLVGTVKNCLQGVEIVVSGEKGDLAAFQGELRREFPMATQVVLPYPSPEAFPDFQILSSDADGALSTVIPRDRVLCDECLLECLTPGDRRYGFALNSCTRCGPRFSIMTGMPYDRSRTSMDAFAMCDACSAEYEDPLHRRYHAQTNCCPTCGPRLWFEEGCRTIDGGEASMLAAAEVILGGGILAVKGLGGYQLLCDARNETAVSQLRRRKRRLKKPLAVMVASMNLASELAEVDPLEAACLRDSAGPIVLLRALKSSCVAANVHPDLRDIGVFLPSTAMHHLLLRRLQIPVVVTSGNIEGEPLEYDEREATCRLSTIADAFLHHNRPIIQPIDDSVVRVVGGRRMTIRAARGLAPISFWLPSTSSCIAFGGLQKAAVAVSNRCVSLLGPHIGDLQTVRSRQHFREQASRLQRLLGAEAPRKVFDSHPDAPVVRDVPLPSMAEEVCVQHHHAHIVAAMVEAGWLSRRVLGVAFDGMGMGSDGRLWGGEILLATKHSFQRVGHWRPFALLGGDAAVKQPWRIALTLMVESLGEEETQRYLEAGLARSWSVERDQMVHALRVLRNESFSPITTSLGRIFDGVASLVCGFGQVDFEGEAAMRFESLIPPESLHAALGGFEEPPQEPFPSLSVELERNLPSAQKKVPHDVYACPLSLGIPFEIDWRPMIAELIADMRANIAKDRIALKFHQTVAATILEIGNRFLNEPIVFAGGVFQNRILVECIDQVLGGCSTPYFFPSQVPINDGGLALGQLAVANSMKEAVCA